MPNFNGGPTGDVFTGGADNDTAVGNGGNDQLSGGGGYDLLVGNAGADTLNGDDGDDTLYSSDESPPFNLPYYGNLWTAPLLDTGAEVDTLNGGSGNDRIFAGYGDNVDGGANDAFGDKLFISFMGASSGVTADFRLASQTIGGGTITGIENISWVQGSDFDDDINVESGSGNGYTDFTAVFGMGGNDRLVAGYYTGTLFGGDGNDIVDGRGSQYLQKVEGGDGDDTLYTATNTFAEAHGGAGNDTIYSHGTTYGGSGDDLIVLAYSYYGGIVYGEDGDDEIRASSAGHTMSGGSGADILTGDGGIDYVYSAGITLGTAADDMGLEQDVLTGFGGNDVLAAGYGDSVDGGSGSDTLRYSLGGLTGGISFNTAGFVSGQPFAIGGGTINGVETLTYLRGTDFADSLTLATQAQLLTVNAGDGNDLLIANGSSVSAHGGNGNDRFISGIAGDIFDGGVGIDTADYRNYASAITVQLGLTAGSTGSGPGGDQLINVEDVDGSAFDDTIWGSNEANRLLGLNGSDTLKGFGGADQLDGGAGADQMAGGTGNDWFYVDDAGDAVEEAAGEGADRVFASTSYALAAGVSVETLSTASNAGTAAIDLTGNELANTIYGNDGANVLDGKGGADGLVGRLGDDWFHVDNGADQVVELAGEGNDRVLASVSYTLGAAAHVELLTTDLDTGTGAINLTGNGFANTIRGNDGANSLDGKGGADILVGRLGNDFYYVDNGADQVVEVAGEGTDRVFASVNYTLGAGVSVETLTTTNVAGTGAINLTGNEFANLIYGNDGANILDGRAGADTLVGRLGDDFYYVDNVTDQVVEAAGQGNDRLFAAASYTLAAGAEIELMSTTLHTGTGAIDLTGNAFANMIYGNDGNNVLDGKGGVDILVGRLGDDSYHVDNAADRIVESAGQGNDRLFASASYALGAGVSVELMGTVSATGTGAINLTGNELSNAIHGNDGNNILDGKAGADTLVGRLGDDWYHVDNAADLVTESAGQGNDRIFAGTSYVLGAGVSVEMLTTTSAPGTAAINLTGNELANIIHGNDGANILDGRAGADMLVGRLGNDFYHVDDAADLIVEAAGQGADRAFASVSYALGAGVSVETLTTSSNTGTGTIDLTGNELANTIYGNDGANVLDGKGGSDTLVGRAGADSFGFTTALGAANVDRIADFSSLDDIILLDDGIFAGIGGPGALDAGAFVTGAAAQDADDRIVYDQTTGRLFFDADGNGAGAAILFAKVDGIPVLTAADFMVI